MNTALWTLGIAALTLALAAWFLLKGAGPTAAFSSRSWCSGALGSMALVGAAALGLVELILFGVRAMRS